MLKRLYYEKQDKLIPLPEWAHFFNNIGIQVSSLQLSGCRAVVAIAVPTRSFAAAFTMIGVVTNSLTEESKVTQSQIQHLLNLPIGTTVHVHRNKNKIRAIIEDFSELDGKKRVVLKTSEAEMLWLPVETYAAKISVSETDVSLPKYRQKGRRVRPPSDFLKVLFGANAAQRHVTETSLDVVAIGKNSLLQRELCDVNFYCLTDKPKNKLYRSHLQDIVRVREFSGTNRAYKSQSLPAVADPDNLLSKLDDRDPSIVIFDGATAYPKHEYSFPTANQVIILDRTDRQFLDAVQRVNQRYADRLNDITDLQIRVPPGIEMMLFTERS